MTTIIAMNTPDDQAIYADSLADGAGIAIRGMRKLVPLAPQCVMGWCGLAYVGELAASIVQKTTCLDDVFTHSRLLDPLNVPPEDAKDFAALVLFQGKIWIMHEQLFPLEIQDPFTARGSGAHFAIGALAAGANPWQALEIACQYDISTGQPLFRMGLDGKIEVYHGNLSWSAQEICHASP